MVVWTDGMKLNLLFTMIEVGDVTNKWDLITAKMGSEFTSESIRSMHKKMRKDREKFLADQAAGIPATPATPKGRKRKGTATATAISDGNATKKVKGGLIKKGNGGVKAEEDVEGSGDDDKQAHVKDEDGVW
ncbi:hypothetical protein EJ08DRAFT_695211 [Tothia fuscella]|uniref:Uncharacterized protein n=1 Tax=Tothia fuscella TaxID=1048955 RepID=A0A9P4NW39_9PEZI|nr:hypothetical protein EJ08DRAFT_695211 [Tothia fuscella]